MWKVENGDRKGDYYAYECGKMKQWGNWDNLLYSDDLIHIEDGKKGRFMVIEDHDTQKVYYRGSFNSEMKRDGLGVEYDRKSGELLYNGVWKNDELIKIIRYFSGDRMIEFDARYPNLDLTERHPIYEGGYTFDEKNLIFKRDGIGYLIDPNARYAICECVWKNGKLVERVELKEGWYILPRSRRSSMNGNSSSHPTVSPLPKFPNPLNSSASASFSSSTLSDTSVPSTQRDVASFQSPQLDQELGIYESMTELVIPKGSCNHTSSLKLTNLPHLESISIGDNCFQNAESFQVDGLENLKQITIGHDSFINTLSLQLTNQSFKVTNCNKLQTISIGSSSFAAFNTFIVEHLDSLAKLEIGKLGEKSGNFLNASLKLKSRNQECNLSQIFLI